MNDRLKSTLYTCIKGWGVSLCAALLITTSFRSSFADWNDIPTGSMEPTILIGDRVFVNKLAYDLKVPYTTKHLAHWSEPKRGDIVVFFSPVDGTRLIKRIVGIPGDSIAMQRNKLVINGIPLGYEFSAKEDRTVFTGDAKEKKVLLYENITGKKHLIKLLPARQSLHSFRPVTVPEGHYFMLGDNRDNSADSRYFGFVGRDRIVGRATMVALSRQDSFLHPRWSRFFKELI